MIELGKMAPEGMKLYQYAIDNCLLPEPEKKTGGDVLFPEVPDYFTKALDVRRSVSEGPNDGIMCFRDVFLNLPFPYIEKTIFTISSKPSFFKCFLFHGSFSAVAMFAKGLEIFQFLFR